MKTQMLLHSILNRKAMMKRISFHLFMLIVCFFLIGFFGCKGRTVSPTVPEVETPVPPSPTGTETPERVETPTLGNVSCDDYAENADDPDVKILETDGEPYVVTMDCTGDIDWYKIELSSLPKSLTILLTDIPDKKDFDIFIYDSQLAELEDGRSAHAGNTEEQLSFIIDNESVIYLKIYSFSGWGEATLTVTAEDTEDNGNNTGDNFEQLTYEEILSTEFPFYPRGSNTGPLERSVESVVVEPISCQISDVELSGELTIGHYAHVERELLESVDYIDGWALVLFNGSEEFLDVLNVTIRVTIFAPDIDLEITIPPDMEIQGNDYLISETSTNVYYASQSYGDFLGNTSNDIQISSGVVGDLGDLFSNNMFTQQIDVEWRFEDDAGTVCSGELSGEAIIDFRKRMFFLNFNDIQTIR